MPLLVHASIRYQPLNNIGNTPKASSKPSQGTPHNPKGTPDANSQFTTSHLLPTHHNPPQTISKSVVASGGMALVMEAVQLFYYSRFLLPVYLAVGLLAYLLGMRALDTADIDCIESVRSDSILT
jgi:hypothetical protein